MSLPLHERAQTSMNDPLVRLSVESPSVESLSIESSPGGVSTGFQTARVATATPLIPYRLLAPGEQYRFHFDMTKCIGCRSCEIACNEQNGNPADIHWRRVGEVEGGVYPDTHRHYLSMGCNHCLDADCLKGCPVDAYTKDAVTGIVLHSPEACIGCQYCVWNCPYSVPQFNPDRGVVGKCDMCHDRLTDGLEPACVNACPEAAIEIEIVSKAAWRIDYAGAESPGMPAAGHTISTTRVTLPELADARLERVDTGRIIPEHPHFSLVVMTTLIQSIIGSLCFLSTEARSNPVVLGLLTMATVFALNLSVLHLGRPAYAWRALKMWRRSWLSREVLLFGLFFASLGILTVVSANQLWSRWIPILVIPRGAVLAMGAITIALGIAGILASAFIYLIPARPSWNKIHTPLDFLLSAALLGELLANLLTVAVARLGHLPFRVFAATMSRSLPTPRTPGFVVLAIAALWLTNQTVRILRLRSSSSFEESASAELVLETPIGRAFAASMVLIAASATLALSGQTALAFFAAMAGVLCARFVFFVSVVPLNMALTFLKAGNR